MAMAGLARGADEPYKHQPILCVAPIVIKRGCWIGQNVVILPSVTIGELSIVGANSVVTKNVPARSIAIGTPARVIRKWEEATHMWIDVSWTPESDADPVPRVAQSARVPRSAGTHLAGALRGTCAQGELVAAKAQGP
jgi:hypothetical protein